VKKYVVIGTGGHADSIVDLLTTSGHKIDFFIGFDKSLKTHKNLPVININEVKDLDYNLILGIGDYKIRNEILSKLPIEEKNLQFPPIVHAKSFISNEAIIDDGTIIFANTYIGPNVKIGKFCLINTGTIIEHGCTIGDLNVFGPQVTLAGSTITGSKCYFGMGALVSDNISIGSESIIAANSFVNVSIPSNSFVTGTPARVRKK